MDDPDSQRWKEFENIGEDAVRGKVSLGLYSGANLRRAKAWLEKKNQARSSESSRRKEASNSEQSRTARSAKNAAWAAAIAAIIAAIITAISAVIVLTS